MIVSLLVKQKWEWFPKRGPIFGFSAVFRLENKVDPSSFLFVILQSRIVGIPMALFTRCWSLVATRLSHPLIQRSVATSFAIQPHIAQTNLCPLTLSTLFGMYAISCFVVHDL